ncbi:MAG: metallophosphoesterase [Promethearchaeota archaeon]
MRITNDNWNGKCFTVSATKPTFRILQVTDLHLSNFIPLDKRCLRSIREIALKHGADLVVITGDIFGLRKVAAMKRTIRTVDKVIGNYVPWTFAWGNHDQELHFNTPDPRVPLDKIEAYLESMPNCIYKQTRQFMENQPGPSYDEDVSEKEAWGPLFDDRVPARNWDGFYGGNFRIELIYGDSKVPAWNVFILNSRRGHHIPPKVLNWMESEIGSMAGRVPAVCFYHVPNYEYDVIWERGIARGIKREKVCFEGDRGRIHARFKKFGVVRACFVGHDHVNDYHGMLDGIDYVYGRKSCLGGYGSYRVVPEEFKESGKAIKIGAKLIELGLTEDGGNGINLSYHAVFRDGSTGNPGE